MKNPNDLLRGLPDKWESKTTTSKKWKLDLHDFIVANEVSSVLEIGAAVGYTTHFLAHFVDKVTSVELEKRRVDESKKLSEGLKNINFICDDVYKGQWKYGYHDLIIIDCVHEYSYVKKDIENAISLNPKYLAFDDYGLFPEVKKAVDEQIAFGRLKVVKHLGYPKGTHFGMSNSPNTTKGRVLDDFEGLVCANLVRN
jgi:SAM-dependent methyltransferase